MSGGQLQRLAIGRALYFSPSILILDEATNALDNKTEEDLFTSLKNIEGITIILMLTHRSSAIQQCDHIFHLTSDCVEKIDKSSVKDLSKYLNKINDIGRKKLKDTVLITGADGFIGSHLTEFLVKKNYKVKVMCVYNSFNTWGWLDSIEKDLLEDVEVILGDVRDPKSD